MITVVDKRKFHDKSIEIICHLDHRCPINDRIPINAKPTRIKLKLSVMSIVRRQQRTILFLFYNDYFKLNNGNSRRRSIVSCDDVRSCLCIEMINERSMSTINRRRSAMQLVQHRHRPITTRACPRSLHLQRQHHTRQQRATSPSLSRVTCTNVRARRMSRLFDLVGCTSIARVIVDTDNSQTESSLCPCRSCVGNRPDIVRSIV
jgi:hypothetical protein